MPYVVLTIVVLIALVALVRFAGGYAVREHKKSVRMKKWKEKQLTNKD